MKKFLFVVVSLFLSLNFANANDLLFKASNGALNQNSLGVKKLSDEEMAQVRGGLIVSFYNGYFERQNAYTAFFTLSLRQSERRTGTLDIRNGKSTFRNYSDFALFARGGTPVIQVTYNTDSGHSLVQFATIDPSGRYWYSAGDFSRDLINYARNYENVVNKTIQRSRIH